MFSSQVSKHSQTAASADLLTSQQVPESTVQRANSFDNILQQRFKTPDRSRSALEGRTSANEGTRAETRAAEPKRAESQRIGKDSHASATGTSAGSAPPPDKAASSDSAADAQQPAEPTTTAKTPSGEANAKPTEEVAAATTEATTATPASFAVFSSIIAALSGTSPADAKTAVADASAASDETLEGDLLADPERKAIMLVGGGASDKAGLTKADKSNIADPADGLLAKSLAASNDNDATTTKPVTGEAKPFVGPAIATPTAPAAQANGAAAAPIVNGVHSELAATAMAAGGVGAPNRPENQAVQQLPVYTPAGHKAWAEDVGNRLIWMANRSESRAELMLTPPSLGKLGVSIQVSGDQTTAQFVAATPAAREALEQAMPRLRELLQQAGINLGQTDVSTSGEHQAREGGSRQGRDAGGRVSDLQALTDAEPEHAVSRGWTAGGNGMIDIFA